jgi:transcriptional regulator with XRE-family HTH domain
MTKIGTNIKLRREELGMSQDELAEKMGYKSRSTIAKIEKGVNDVVQSNIVKFADVLKTTPSRLMGWEDGEVEITEGMKKKTELANDIVIRMGSNDEFCELVKILYKLDTKKLSSIKNLLANFIEQ